MKSSVIKILQKLDALDGAAWAVPLFIVSTAAATAAGLWIGEPYLLPILQALAAWPFFVASCANGKIVRAAARILIFALVAGAIVSYFVAQSEPNGYNSTIFDGEKYRGEMFVFVRSGGVAGEEAHPSQFLPMHALHCGMFMILCAATAGFAALVLGAYLLNYMSYYVGALLYEATRTGSVWTTLASAWSPYAIVRVIAYAVLGAGITVFLYGPPQAKRRALAAIFTGIGLAVVDVLLKSLIAGHYGQTLLHATGLK
ncbi:MAG: hypothetical protein ACKVS6_14135 [Planctomycetota bacterium]